MAEVEEEEEIPIMEGFVLAVMAEAEDLVFPTVEETTGRGLLGEMAVAVATMGSTS